MEETLLLSIEHSRRPHVPSSLDQLFESDYSCFIGSSFVYLDVSWMPELAHAARGPYGQPAMVGAGSSGG